MLRTSIFVPITAAALLITSALAILSAVGKHAAPGEIPFAAQVHITKIGIGIRPPNVEMSRCGAAIISPNVVLTAAHCVANGNGNETTSRRVKVVTGEVSWGFAGEHVQIRQVKQVVLVESYTEFLDIIPVHDPALLVLNYPLEYSEWVQPIRVPLQNQTFEGNATTCGWGLVDNNSFSDQLMKAEVQILDRYKCQRVSMDKLLQNHMETKTNDTAAAAAARGHILSLRDAQSEEDMIADICVTTDSICPGDSGGPLICDAETGPVVCGILSWSSRHEICKEGQTIANVAVAVANYSDWIQMKLDEFNFTCDPATEFNCGDGACVPLPSRCDGTLDCSQGTDEIECYPCGLGQFRCASASFLRCIDTADVCDQSSDCPDASDELACSECGLGDFWCGGWDEGGCIDGALLCNGAKDCGSKGRDELGCKECHSAEFSCGNRNCVPSSTVCDGVDNCRDGSDELDCKSGIENVTGACDGRMDLETCLLRGCVFNFERKECVPRERLIWMPSQSNSTAFAPEQSQNGGFWPRTALFGLGIAFASIFWTLVCVFGVEKWIRSRRGAPAPHPVVQYVAGAAADGPAGDNNEPGVVVMN